MNATGSMGLAVAVRPCRRLLAAHLFPGCPHHRLPSAALFLVPGLPHDRRHFSSKRPRPLGGGGGSQRRYASSLVRAAVAPAKDGAALSDARGLSTSVGPLSPGSDRALEQILIQGLAAVKPLVIERVEPEKERMAVVEEKVDERAEVAKVREESESMKEAWRLLKNAVVSYCGSPVGTVAANDPAVESLNYDQVFIRDFVPSSLAFLLKGETEIVRNFLLYTLQLQSWEKTVDCYSPGQGLMPASFKVRSVPLDGSKDGVEEMLDPDFGESAIGRVAPVDSGLWWIILLRAYGKITGDYTLQERVDVQTGIKLILNLCLSDGFDMFPTLLVTDGSCMIDRRMGIHGHPLEIQVI